MNERTKRLREIMHARKWTSADVAAILERTPQTVRVWRSRYDQRTIPADALKVLEMMTAAKR